MSISGLFADDKKDSQDVQGREMLRTNLGFEHFYWYPLHDPRPLNSMYFEEDAFLKEFGIEKLIGLIAQLGFDRLNVITETEEDEKITITELEEYSGIEKIYFDDKGEWAIYFSHENTVTFVGTIITDSLKVNWNNWKAFSDPWESC